MNIALSPETQKLIQEKLRGGDYRSADDLVRAAMAALDELDAHGLDEQALDAIDRAEEQIDRGEVHDWKDVREQVRARFLGR